MDEYTEVTSEGWFSRLLSSIKGVVTGLIIFLIAFPLLFWNEGRAVKRAKDLSQGRGALVSISADKVEQANEGKLVHLSGIAETDATLSDSEFQVTAENVLALRRVVEMYQWQENKRTETRKKVGGKKETVTTYDYEKVWSETEINSSSFKKSAGHRNPGNMAFESKTERADKVTLGAFELGGLAQQINTWSPLSVDRELNMRAGRPLRLVNGGYYFGKDPGNPDIGDLRISFKVIEPLEVTVVAVQSGESFKAFEGDSGSTIFRLSPGEHTADQMFEAMESENTTMLWVFRIVGFLMMAAGISAVFKPLVVVADVVPIFGDMLEFGIGLVAFVLAAPLALITIAIGWVAYRPIVGIGLLVVAVGILVGGFMLAKSRKA